MCLLRIRAHSFSRIFEVLPEEVENTELMVEDAVSLALLKHFEEATVDEVITHFSPASHTGQRDCSIQILARGSLQSSLPPTKEQLELAVKESMCSILKELFGPVMIDSVIIESSLIKSA